ncbi:hypothetical protein ACU4GD_37820 [Cupriavidus basilensis]
MRTPPRPNAWRSGAASPVAFAEPDQAVAQADIVVTASRSTTPLFCRPGAQTRRLCRGDRIEPAAHPRTGRCERSRASKLVVEWRPQSMREAGDIVLADPAALPADKIVELADVVTGRIQPRGSNADILIYKSVGVGLEDVRAGGLGVPADRRGG